MRSLDKQLFFVGIGVRGMGIGLGVGKWEAFTMVIVVNNNSAQTTMMVAIAIIETRLMKEGITTGMVPKKKCAAC